MGLGRHYRTRMPRVAPTGRPAWGLLPRWKRPRAAVLQKPSPAVQAQQQAIDAYGQSVLDIGVFSLDAATAECLLKLCDVRPDASGKLAWNGPIAEAAERHGFDFYREVCVRWARTRLRGPIWPPCAIAALAGTTPLCGGRSIRSTPPLAGEVLRRCDFLHFGTSRQIIESGQQLLRSETGFASGATGPLCMNSRLDEPATVSGKTAWIEGSAIRQALTLAGENLLVGVDVQQPLELPRHACLDLLPGRDRTGRSVTFSVATEWTTLCRVRRPRRACCAAGRWTGGQSRQATGKLACGTPPPRRPTGAYGMPGSFLRRPSRPSIAAGCGYSIPARQPPSSGILHCGSL